MFHNTLVLTLLDGNVQRFELECDTDYHALYENVELSLLEFLDEFDVDELPLNIDEWIVHTRMIDID